MSTLDELLRPFGLSAATSATELQLGHEVVYNYQPELGVMISGLIQLFGARLRVMIVDVKARPGKVKAYLIDIQRCAPLLGKELAADEVEVVGIAFINAQLKQVLASPRFGYRQGTIDIPERIGDDGTTDSMTKVFSVREVDDDNG